jgi:hypothetical protein
MKQKLVVFSILLLIFSSRIEKFLWNKKQTYFFKKSINFENSEIYNKKFNNYISGSIISNNWTELIINKGSKDGVSVNKMVEGNNGFVGIVTQVEEHISIVRTFWCNRWKLIVIDGLNNYGTLKSNGYFLSLQSYRAFENNSELFIFHKNTPVSIGYVKKWNKFIFGVIPRENILTIKTVYIKK